MNTRGNRLNLFCWHLDMASGLIMLCIWQRVLELSDLGEQPPSAALGPRASNDTLYLPEST